ncbi:hypothetical protein QUF58_00875 [Anaerolineales bacterium HSG24]|nr:hypothetical protein [Anaerolineales bacterium HSG24]
MVTQKRLSLQGAGNGSGDMTANQKARELSLVRELLSQKEIPFWK